jgi:oxygen-independent coproporphyrinogen-3 oxidase
LTERKAGLLAQAGVNRISLGAQSLRPRTLEYLGRVHGPAEVPAAVRTLRKAGFDNIGLDLMYAVPGSEPGDLDRDLDGLIELEPEHLSCYCLSIEPDTALERAMRTGRSREVDDDEARRQYDRIRDRLAEAGFRHYELSNFARPGRESRHNLLYWQGGDYAGCGPSAASHRGGRRWSHPADLDRYCRGWLEGNPERVDEEELDPESRAREAAYLGLRLTRGISPRAYLARTGFDFRVLFREELAELQARGLIEDTPHAIRLTPRAYFISNWVFARFL